MTERLQRLVFGEDAELYDATRPRYPDELVDDLVAWSGSAGTDPRALEVGAGTGKATRLLAARGVSVLAVEPDAAMAAIARRRISGPGAVDFVVSDFEHADLGSARFPLVYAGQAWHWVAQPAGYAKAREALQDGGRLVVFWNREDWSPSPLHGALNEAYSRVWPDEPPPIHPSARRDAENPAENDWVAEIAETDGFAEPEVRWYDWRLRHTADSYADLLSSHSHIRLLDAEPRRALLHAVRKAINEHGGSFEVPMYVRVCVARAT